MDTLYTNSLIAQGLQLRHMRLAVALHDLRQVGAAAERVGLTQPAASRMLSDLEGILGAEFCKRGPRGITLTPVGAAFAARARRILVELGAADEELGLVSRGEKGTVRVGAVTAPSVSIVAPVIEELTAEHPEIGAEVVVGTSEVLAQRLLDGAIDFALCRIPDRMDTRDFEAAQLKRETISMICAADHPLAGRTVPERDLAGERWVMQPRGNPLRQAVDGHFLGQGEELPNVVLSTTSLLLHVALVTRSKAIGAVASDVAHLLAGGGIGPLGIKEINLPVTPSVPPFSLLRRRGHDLLPIAELVYERILARSNR